VFVTTGCNGNHAASESTVDADNAGGGNANTAKGGATVYGQTPSTRGATTEATSFLAGGSESSTGALGGGGRSADGGRTGGKNSLVGGTGGVSVSSSTTTTGRTGASAAGASATGGTAPKGSSSATMGGAPATGGAGTSCGAGTSTANDVVIDLSSLQQKISGFGVSSAWAGNYANASDAEYLWSTTTGAGLTLLRIRYGDGLSIAKSAASYGVTVWMTPWGTGTNGAPGGPYTTTQANPNGCTSGSMPVLTNPTGFASTLVTWVQSAKTQGVPIYAVSAGNEPDSCGINQTTSYSAAQMATWIETLGPAMAAINVKIMAPETMNWYAFPRYFAAIKDRPVAYGYVDIFAGHRYGLGPDSKNADVIATNKAIAADTTKEYWQTEVDTGTANGDPTGDGIASALLMAKEMHIDLTVVNLNAWHIWWLYNASGNGGFLYDTTTKVWSKRLWVLGNFSRFVRPGFKRVATSGISPSGVLLSAYTNPVDGTVALVAINNNTSAANLSVFIAGAAPCSMTPYVTSEGDSLASKPAISVSGSRFSVSLGAQSVSTFVGKP
jgi:glucuronoarabinoxylan endo-1,4-beta-xylanase